MLVEFSSDNYVFKLLEAGKLLKDKRYYNQLTFRRSLPFAYREASKILDKNRLGLIKAKSEDGARVYDSIIEFIGHFLCLRVRLRTPDNRGGIWSNIAYYAPPLENPSIKTPPVLQGFQMSVTCMHTVSLNLSQYKKIILRGLSTSPISTMLPINNTVKTEIIL